MNKDEFWKALCEPVEKDCGNCAFNDGKYIQKDATTVRIRSCYAIVGACVLDRGQFSKWKYKCI